MSDPPRQCEFDADALEVSVNEEIPCDVEEITPLVDRVMAIAGQMECARGKEFEIELALREALANAIRHGCQHDASKTVACCVACDPSRGMLIVVRDPGPGFDPAALPSPVAGQRLFENHGRGIYLINQLMDEVRFEKGGTEIHMTKRWPGPGRSS